MATFAPSVDELKAAAKAAASAKGAGGSLPTEPTIVVLGDEARPAVEGLVPDLRGLSARGALRAAAAAGHELQLSGSGLVVAQEPLPGVTADGPIAVKLALGDEARR